MTCHDFELSWNQLLDADAGGLSLSRSSTDRVEAALRSHVETCRPCRQKMLGYERLRRSIGLWARPSPPTPADLASRILAALQAEPGPVSLPDPIASPESDRRVGPHSHPVLWASRPESLRESRHPAIGGVAVLFAIAASVLALMMLPGWLRPVSPQPGGQGGTEVVAGAAGPRAGSVGSGVAGGETPLVLSRALADATWDLAYEASAPAARIGWLGLDSAMARGDIAAEPQPGPAPAAETAKTGPGQASGGGLDLEDERVSSDSPRMVQTDPSSALDSASDRKPQPAGSARELSIADASGNSVSIWSMEVALPGSRWLSERPGAVLNEVGDRVVSRVRPLSASARHAFGFLLGPVSPQREPRDRSRAPVAKGA
jgi:hypothetical protein